VTDHTHSPNDPKQQTEALRLAYEASLRALQSQEQQLDGLRSKGTTLVAASSLITTFLGGYVLKSQRFGILGIMAAACFVVVVVLTICLMWPTWPWRFEQSAAIIIGSYIDRGDTIDEILRDLALRLEQTFSHNLHHLNRLYILYGFALAFLLAEAILWVARIAFG
jgi:hypothetical protein